MNVIYHMAQYFDGENIDKFDEFPAIPIAMAPNCNLLFTVENFAYWCIFINVITSNN